MARIRTIKPTFFRSDDVCALSPLARLLFIGLWCEADREGRLEWKPRTFKRTYLPDDDCDGEAIAAELVKQGVVVLYGDGLAYIPSFLKHQVINQRESASKLPEPPVRAPTSTVQAHAHTDLHSGEEEGEGEEEKELDSEEPDGSSGAVAPQVDPIKVLFDEGVRLLTEHDCKPTNARSIIAKWRKERGDEAVMAALVAFRLSSSTEPISWITQRLSGQQRETWRERQVREAEAAIDKALQ